jgi:hypothetical protein
MHRRFTLASLSIVAAAAAAISFAPAAGAESFLGLSAGRSQWPSGACAVGGRSCDRGDTAWALKGGVGLVPLLSLEARYFDLGRARSEGPAGTVTFGDGSSSTVGMPTTLKAAGVGVGASIAVPIAPFLALTGLAGVSRVRAKIDDAAVTVTTSGGTATSYTVGGSWTTSQPYYGLGLRFTFAPNLDASLEAQRYRASFGGGKTDIDVLAAGLTYRF